MKRETLIDAYMKEYGLSKEEAEKRADKALAAVAELYKQENETDELPEGEEEWWDVSEVLCVHCLERWIAVRPASTMLKDIQCPRCSFRGAVIETGQEFYYDDIEGLFDEGCEDGPENEPF